MRKKKKPVLASTRAKISRALKGKKKKSNLKIAGGIATTVALTAGGIYAYKKRNDLGPYNLRVYAPAIASKSTFRPQTKDPKGKFMKKTSGFEIKRSLDIVLTPLGITNAFRERQELRQRKRNSEKGVS